MVQAIGQRSAAAAGISKSTRQTSQPSDPLDRLAELSTRVTPYSTEAITIGLICVGASTAPRFLASWTNSDFLFVTYVPAILAAGLVAGILLENFLYYDPRPFVVAHFIPLIPHIQDSTSPSRRALPQAGRDLRESFSSVDQSSTAI